MVRSPFGTFCVGLLALGLAAGCGGKSDEDFSLGAAGGPADGADLGSSGGRTGSGGRTAVGSGGLLGDGGAEDTPGGTSSGVGGGGIVPPSLGGGSGDGGLAVGACSNGLDDDGDGFADGMDAECTGAYDDDERTFATGIPGDNVDPKWQDCFFDGNSGAGDDGCRYHTDCITGDAAPSDASCAISDECREFCQPRTPNGCDCFGCCTVQDAEGTSLDVYITASCSTHNLDDTGACPRCTKSADCENTCGRCELCPGKTEADLPDDCGATDPPDEPPPDEPPPDEPPPDEPPPDEPPPPDIDPPSYECEDGRLCSAQLPCPSDMFCHQGCCLVTIF